MESFQAAALARELGVPFAAVRVVADPVERELPPAVHSGLQPDGSVALAAVFDSLAREPGQIFSLARVTLDAYRRVPRAVEAAAKSSGPASPRWPARPWWRRSRARRARPPTQLSGAAQLA